MTPLTPHFSLEELTASQAAARHGMGNCPSPAIAARLRLTASLLEKVRTLLGDRVISVSSGYRSPAVNRLVGGARNSAHTEGWAVDFNCWSFGEPLEACRAIAASDIPFDQLIEEGTWIHISFAPALRRQVLTKAPGRGYIVGLRAGKD